MLLSLFLAHLCSKREELQQCTLQLSMREAINTEPVEHPHRGVDGL